MYWIKSALVGRLVADRGLYRNDLRSYDPTGLCGTAGICFFQDTNATDALCGHCPDHYTFKRLIHAPIES